MVLSALDLSVSGPRFDASDGSLSFHSFFLFYLCQQNLMYIICIGLGVTTLTEICILSMNGLNH